MSNLVPWPDGRICKATGKVCYVEDCQWEGCELDFYAPEDDGHEFDEFDDEPAPSSPAAGRKVSA